MDLACQKKYTPEGLGEFCIINEKAEKFIASHNIEIIYY